MVAWGQHTRAANGQSRARLLSWGVALSACLLALSVGGAIGPDPASAWDIVKSTNGVILQRSIDDTLSTSPRLYYDYKGGDAWTSVYSPFAAGSFNQIWQLPYMGTAVDCIEIPLVDGYVCQMVYTSGPSTYMAVLNEPLDVAVVSSVPLSVEGTFTPSGTLPVSMDSSVSILGTMPVSIVDTSGAMMSVGGANLMPYLLAALLAVCMVLLVGLGRACHGVR